MIDSRFYEKRAYLTLGRICELLSIDVPQNQDPERRICDIATLRNATNSDITFFHNAKYASELSETKAGACILRKDHASLVPQSVIPLFVDEPYLAHAILLKEFYSIKSSKNVPYISSKASISENAIIEEGCYISDNVVIKDGALIRKNTYIDSNTTILEGVEIGEESIIDSNVSIGFAIIGKRVRIKSGARIGQQGFGFHVGKTGITDVLQVGRVIIGDDVQIGSNCTIDRGSMGDTKIGSHSRIDNLVHVAHNVEIGEYCVIAAQTGIAGSTTIGSQCFFGGQVGISGHLKIGNRVTIAAQSGVMKDTPDGNKIAGSPALNAIFWHRQTIALRKLVEERLSLKKLGIIDRLKLFLKK